MAVITTVPYLVGLFFTEEDSVFRYAEAYEVCYVLEFLYNLDIYIVVLCLNVFKTFYFCIN